ncbi:hypothetical protein ACIPVA_08175 [Streptomyces anulatus]
MDGPAAIGCSTEDGEPWQRTPGVLLLTHPYLWWLTVPLMVGY